MCGKTDEDNLGFTYEELDGFLLGESGLAPETMSKVARLHKATRHKYTPMPIFKKD
jgi:NAD+ synthase